MTATKCPDLLNKITIPKTHQKLEDTPQMGGMISDFAQSK
jgi:hypothetical protein